MPDLLPGASAPQQPQTNIVPTGSSSAEHSSSFDYESHEHSTTSVRDVLGDAVAAGSITVGSESATSSSMLPPSSIAVNTTLGALGSARLSTGSGGKIPNIVADVLSGIGTDLGMSSTMNGAMNMIGEKRQRGNSDLSTTSNGANGANAVNARITNTIKHYRLKTKLN